MVLLTTPTFNYSLEVWLPGFYAAARVLLQKFCSSNFFMMLSFLKTGIFIAVVCSTLLTIVVAQTECPKVDGDSCICKTKSGKYLDLRNIGNSNETNPKYIYLYVCVYEGW